VVDRCRSSRPLLLTFGISIALVNLAQLAFTSNLRAIEYVTGSYTLGPLAFSKSRLIAFVVAAALTGLAFLFLQRTRLGKAIRATSQSREVAMVCGVDVGRIHLITFGVAAALAGAGGALVSVIRRDPARDGPDLDVQVVPGHRAGRRRQLSGALLGGVLLGLVEQIASLFLTTQLSEAVAYVLLVVVLLVRPTGLLGGRQT